MTRLLRARRLTAFLTTLLISAATEAAQESGGQFNLSDADIPKAVLVAEKPGRMFVELTYSKEKQEELRKLTANGLPKSIDMHVGGTPLGERQFTSPAKGHSLKFDFTSLNNALDLVESLGWTPPADHGPVATAPEASLIELTADDVGRVILYLFRPDRCYLEVNCLPARREELTYLLRQSPARPVLVSVGGRIVSELKPDTKVSPSGGVRFDLPDAPVAISVARLLAARP